MHVCMHVVHSTIHYNGSNHWILQQLAKVNQRLIKGHGTKVLLVATSVCLPQSSCKDGRTTDSCFALVVAHQYGVVMVKCRMTGCFCIHPGEVLMVLAEALEANSQQA